MLFLQDCVRWLPKSPKLHGSHNWNSQGSHWASLKGKENIPGSKLYKFSSVNENWKEGRISPEQEAERLEDPDEDVSCYYYGSSARCLDWIGDFYQPIESFPRSWHRQMLFFNAVKDC